MLTDSTNIKI